MKILNNNIDIKKIAQKERNKKIYIHPEESIWPYIQLGLSNKLRDELLLGEIELLEEKLEHMQTKAVPEKLRKFSEKAEYTLFDPEGLNIERFSEGLEKYETLRTLQEKGYVKLTGTHRNQLKEWNTLLDSAISNIKHKTVLIEQGSKSIQVLKPFALWKHSNVPEEVLKPAAEFRSIRRRSPEEFESLVKYINKL
jgi:hypothetical protein